MATRTDSSTDRKPMTLITFKRCPSWRRRGIAVVTMRNPSSRLSCHTLRRSRRRLRSSGAITLLLLGGMLTSVPASAEPASRIAVDNGRVTVDIKDVDLGDVLAGLAVRGGFRLKTSGQLGRVSAAFTNVSLERALRRLVHDHELMLVYGPPPDGGGAPRLVDVAVFAASPAHRMDRVGPQMAVERAALLREIDAPGRAGNAERARPRLTELLVAAPDPTVRARAAYALGRLGGAGATATLTAALTDQTPAVRVQAAHALRRVQGVGAIPVLAALLQADPDVTVRRAAASSLATMPGNEASAALSAAARDPDAAVRQTVSRALQRSR